MEYEFSMALKVTNPQAVYAAAMEHAQVVDGLSEDRAQELLGTADAPYIPNCLMMLFDPGQGPGQVEILESTCHCTTSMVAAVRKALDPV